MDIVFKNIPKSYQDFIFIVLGIIVFVLATFALTIYQNRKKIFDNLSKKFQPNLLSTKERNERLYTRLKSHSALTTLENWSNKQVRQIDYKVFYKHNFTDLEKDKRLWNMILMSMLNSAQFHKFIKSLINDLITAHKKGNDKECDNIVSMEHIKKGIAKADADWIKACKENKINMFVVDTFNQYHSMNDTDILEIMNDIFVENIAGVDCLLKLYFFLNALENVFKTSSSAAEIICNMNSEVSDNINAWDLPEDYKEIQERIYSEVLL